MTVTPLSPSNSSLKVMNAALAQIGVPAISSFTENTLAARVGNLIYSDVLENSLAEYPWRFARDRVQIYQSGHVAPKPWTHVYTIPAAAIVWPGYFRRAFTMELAASLAIPITQDAQTAGGFKQVADGMMLRARSGDSQGRTPSRLDTKLFIRARRTNRGL